MKKITVYINIVSIIFVLIWFVFSLIVKSRLPEVLPAEIMEITLVEKEVDYPNQELYLVKVRYVKRRGQKIINKYSYVYASREFFTNNEVGYIVYITKHMGKVSLA